MNTIEISAIVVSSIGTLLSAILAWVAIYRSNRVQVTFTGNPVDQKEFDKHVAEDRVEYARLDAKLEKSELENRESRRILHRDIDTLGKEVSGLKTASEMTNQRVILMDGKIDRLIENSK